LHYIELAFDIGSQCHHAPLTAVRLSAQPPAGIRVAPCRRCDQLV
jgi:hypothetical protein